jgi:hypothetical protein
MMQDNGAPPEASTSQPRIPRLGPTASGLVALLLVAALRFVPIFGAIVAPLGVLPVLRSQAGGEPGVRAWGPVVALLAAAAVAGFGGLAGFLLAAYALLIVVPSVTIEAWVHWRWAEGRWVGVACLAALLASLAVVGAVAAPESPVAASEKWWNDNLLTVRELYASAGMQESEIERILVSIEPARRIISLLLPTAPLAYFVVVLFWIRPRLGLLGFPLEIGHFEDYRNDDWLAAAFAVAGAGTLLLGGVSRWIAVNLLAVTLILYFVQGLAMIRAHLARWVGRGWLLRWGIALLCLQGPLPLVVATLGIADSFHPMRPRGDDDGGTQ